MTTINQLDPSQEYILKSLLKHDIGEDKNISVVYGPPGTGKSYLILSLLFELSIRKNKILFVSQNVEALDVINRMISKLEDKLIDNKHDENCISFRDFCLMLNRKEHRTLKYMKEQYERMSSKIFSTTCCFANETEFIDDSISYNLSYANLDKKLNNNISETQPIGFDELLTYYLKYVKDDRILSVPVKSLKTIDIRKVFNEFSNFKDEYNQFSKNNHPSNSLRFISKTNCKITLPQIHFEIDRIINLFSATACFPKIQHSVMQTITVIELLNIYKKLHEIITIVDIAALQQDEVNIDELFQSCQKAISFSNKLTDVDDVQGIDDIDNEILCDIDHSNNHLSNREKINNCKDDILRAKQRTEEIINLSSEFANFDIKDIMFNALSIIDSKYFEIVDRYHYLKTIDVKELIHTVDTIKKWNDKGYIYKLLHKIPIEISKLVPDRKRKKVKYLIKEKFILDFAVKMLMDTQYSLDDCRKLYKKSQSNQSAYNPLQDRDIDEINNILNKILVVHEIVLRYNLCSENRDIKNILSVFNRILEHFEIYDKILQKNLSLAGHYPELVSSINTNIKNRKISKMLFPIIKKYAKYLYSGEGKTDFVARAKNIKYREEIKDILSKISIVNNIYVSDVELKVIDELLALLKQAYDNNIFAECFYNINTNENIWDWHERIKNIINFQNISEFDSFINQNEFIIKLKELLGNKNSQIIDNFLKNDYINYKDFAKNVINDLIKSKFNSFSQRKRQDVSGDYFTKYNQFLNNTRKNYLLDGLHKLREYTQVAQKCMKYDKNWTLGGTSMERLQNNTKLISNAFPIIIATPQEVAKYISAEKELFDYVIFDEASQLLPGQALPSIYRAKKAIIIGDPHQMPPTFTTKVGFDNDDEINEEASSILDLAIALQVDSKHHLKIHYRSESNILFEPSRQAIYEEYGIQQIFEAGGNEVMPISIQDNLGTNDAENFCNVVEYIEEKLLLESNNSSFCLLFSRSDVRDTFEDYRTTIGRLVGISDDRLLISTVSNCQGIEGDHSIIYLNHYDSINSMWFFNSNVGAYKRLNVAITRQRKSLKIFMADSKDKWLKVCKRIISNSDVDPDKLKSAKLMESLIENGIKQIGAEYVDSLLKDNILEIDSPLTQQLYNDLINHYSSRIGKDIKIYCGIGKHILVPDDSRMQQNKKHVGFKLDIGIYSPKKKRFVLGIEMDGTIYHKWHRKAFCDAQRREILEIKGWQVYRIWSSNWLNNLNAEFNKLISKIDRLIEN
jgi:superfamily I DNA and/or RNA helicase